MAEFTIQQIEEWRTKKAIDEMLDRLQGYEVYCAMAKEVFSPPTPIEEEQWMN